MGTKKERVKLVDENQEKDLLKLARHEFNWRLQRTTLSTTAPPLSPITLASINNIDQLLDEMPC